jgi:hypothetical protein
MEQTNKRWYQGKAFNGGMGVLDFGLTYTDRQKRNPEESKLVSGGVAAASAAAWMYVPGLMWGMTAISAAKGAGGMMEGIRQKSYEEQFAATANRGVVGGNFTDTEYGATSRQRGMQAIQSSRLNARSALANEARSLHRF